MSRSSLRLYRWLAHSSWPRTYEGKVLVLSLLCVYAPLLVLFGVALRGSAPWHEALPGLLAVFLTTLAGAVLFMGALHALLAPLRLTKEALAAYQHRRALPNLPTDYSDEAGLLMRRTQETLCELDALLQFRQRLLGVISHDLRTPLSTVQLAADLMTDELGQQPLDTKFLAELATTIHTAVQEASQLTSSLLDSAHTDSGLLLRPEPITTTDLLGRLAASVRFLAQRKHIVVRVDDQAHTTLTVDRVKLQQVLTNFATNAIKFTPPQGKVRLVALFEAHEIVFEVHDTGVGFQAAQAAEMFDAFNRTHREGTEGEPGHGLGLWIAKTFAERLGGAVEADSTPGAGSVFRLRLPHATVGLPHLAGSLALLARAA